MIVPYRTKQAIKRVLQGLLALTVLVAVASVCWFIWAQRYIVYTADGQAQLNFDLPPLAAGQAPQKPEEVEVTIRFESGEEEEGTKTDLQQMTGYYVEPEALKNLDEVKAQMAALPAGTPVMMDVKSIHGAFYYSSMVSDTRSSQVDIAKMDELIAWMTARELYCIAKFPALRDYT